MSENAPDQFASLRQSLTEVLHLADSPSLNKLLERCRQQYRQLEPNDRLKVMDFLAVGLEIADKPAIDPQTGREQPATLKALIDSVKKLAGSLDYRDADTVRRLLQLREDLESPRIGVLRQFVNIPGGIKFLVDLRAELRRFMRQHPKRAELRLVDDDLLHLFRSWFNPGFLRLVPINWDTTSAAQLEKLMAYEVVHPMSDWQELRRRLEKDRLCYAFYHANMPDEPLIFVEIALTRTIASSIDRLFDTSKMIEDIGQTTTAVFYSINATQSGLSGVSLGSNLIKTVTSELQRDYPHLRNYATLSPIPLFRPRFLEPILKGEPKAGNFRLRREELESFFEAEGAATMRQVTGQSCFADALASILENDGWMRDTNLRLTLKAGMLRLCFHYLTQEKHNANPFDPVANFHLSNGAMIYNVNYLSNTNAKGMAESFGMTVNYRYDLSRIEQNQEMLRHGECAVAPQLRRMVDLGVSA